MCNLVFPSAGFPGRYCASAEASGTPADSLRWAETWQRSLSLACSQESPRVTPEVTRYPSPLSASSRPSQGQGRWVPDPLPRNCPDTGVHFMELSNHTGQRRTASSCPQMSPVPATSHPPGLHPLTTVWGPSETEGVLEAQSGGQQELMEGGVGGHCLASTPAPTPFRPWPQRPWGVSLWVFFSFGPMPWAAGWREGEAGTQQELSQCRTPSFSFSHSFGTSQTPGLTVEQ